MHQEKLRNMHVSYNLSNILLFFFFIMMIISLLNHSSNAAEQDFCVADLKAQEGPAGFPCKNVAQVTSDDFTFRNFPRAAPQQTFPAPVSLAISFGFKEQFPGLNGLGLGILHLNIGVGGCVPLHTHPRGNEVIFVIQGRIIAGFISSDNKAYYKTLNAGDAWIFPQGLLHFQVNIGNDTARVFASFSSPNPGIQGTTPSIAGNDLPTDIAQKVTFLDNAQVRKLKARFGGTN